MMAVLSKALPLAARSLSPLLGFETRPGHVRKLSLTWGSVVAFTGHSNMAEN